MFAWHDVHVSCFFLGGGLLVKGLGRADWSAVSVMVAH